MPKHFTAEPDPPQPGGAVDGWIRGRRSDDPPAPDDSEPSPMDAWIRGGSEPRD